MNTKDEIGGCDSSGHCIDNGIKIKNEECDKFGVIIGNTKPNIEQIIAAKDDIGGADIHYPYGYNYHPSSIKDGIYKN
ncbi:MAG: hypothetical protein PHN31_05460 [Candidatus Gracilibacteria bacterium]|nr:hypothetical protein [Candidatus Gracilibacteria bacterium]